MDTKLYWDIKREDPFGISDLEIVKGIIDYYVGGWKRFLQISAYKEKLQNEHLTESNNDKYLRILQQLTPQNIADAREWISDCQWGNLDPDDIAELTDIEIVRGVAKHYSGGWEEFLRNG